MIVKAVNLMKMARCKLNRRWSVCLCGFFIIIMLLMTQHKHREMNTSVIQAQHYETNRRKSSGWFNLHLDRSVDVFWNYQNSILSNSVDTWWRKITKSDHDDVTDDLKSFHDDGAPIISPWTDSHIGNMYHTCAVVGNSDIILGSDQGELIDTHDAVIRFNKAPTSGYEKHVGSTTTHRIFYPESTSKDIDYSGITGILLAMKYRDVRWFARATTKGDYLLHSWANVEDKINLSPKNSWIIKPDFIKYIRDKWLEYPENLNKYPSTGMVGVMMALYLCDEINVFAFGPNEKFEMNHYYDVTKRTSASQGGWSFHSVYDELSLYSKLHDENIIGFYGMKMKECVECKLCIEHPKLCQSIKLKN